jgi:DEAD/DEAH box helicase domain-containing protein
LLRVAQFHGSRPKLISATATIGNPREHAARVFGLAEEEVVCIGDSGAPRGARRVYLYNPPVVNAELGIRASYVKQAVMLAADLVRAEVPTIVFGHSRNNVEVMLRYLRDKVAGEIEPERIQGYRGGYLPERRRQIEQKLRTGEILCVVATNALELGIDIGDLDAVICAGYPGSVAATWQRFGRAGRRAEESICVLVTSSAPLDQYLAREPGYLFGAPVEEARIDPDNVEILLQHLKCAAFELPFRKGESFGSLGGEETGAALGFLVQHRVLHEAGGSYHWATDAYPANNVSLRSIGWDNVVIIAKGERDGQDKVLAEIDFRGAHTMVHEQAIYQHDGECYEVEKFDYENHKAFVNKVVPDYFTDAMTYTQISVIEEESAGAMSTRPNADVKSGWGEVSVVEKVVGYKKIKFYTHENTGYGEVHLPEMQMHTTSFWLTVPESKMNALPGGKATGIDALRGVGIALETVATFALMCDPRDLGTAMGDVGPEDGAVPTKGQQGPRPGYDPTLFLYEHVPGGTGLAERIFALREELAHRARIHIERCPCESGCPACVGPVSTPYAKGHSRKSVALELLDVIAPK